MRRFPVRLPIVISGVFFLSGFASLIDQVAWQRLLTLQYGAGAVSITLVVSVYMFGLGLGALLGGRLAQRSLSPYILYAVVQGSLGAAGLASLACLPALGAVTAAASPAVSLAALFVFLCIPTMLMGITLPVVVAIAIRLSPDFIGTVGRLYSVNTLGAACGALFTGYVFVSLLGLDGCIVLAAAIDAVLAVTILLVWPRAPAASAPADDSDRGGRAGPGWIAYPLVFCTGFIAIGYEIVWYRVIGVLVKDSPYAFASILAVYLLGVALGSRALHRIVARWPAWNERDLFFTLQVLIGATVLLSFIGYYYLSRVPPVRDVTRLSFLVDQHPPPWPFLPRPGLQVLEDLYLLLDVFLWPLAFMLVPTMLMGASFPLIASVAVSRRGREGAAIGTTYFFGVLGNVLGGLVTGLVLLPALGSERTILMFGVLGLLFGLAPRGPAIGCPGVRPPLRARRVGAVLMLAALSTWAFPRRGDLYLAMHVPPFPPDTVRVEEGLDAVVVTYGNGELVRNFINGQGHGYRPGPVFLAEAFEGLSHAAVPRNVLVIGLGAGTIAEAALIPSEVERVTIVELCESAVANLRKFPALASVLEDRRVRMVTADGRRFLQQTGETYDVILMDPLRTTTAYSNNLHSREFFALAGRHLKPGGILMVGGVDANLVIPRTLLTEFPAVRAYSRFCLASRSPLVSDHERRERLLMTVPEDRREDILVLIADALEGDALTQATAGYPPNLDWRPVSEYYLGLRLRERLHSRP